MSWRSWCYQFRGRAARAIGLDFQHQQSRYADALDRYVRPGAAWLDLGCGHQFFPGWAAKPGASAAELSQRARLVAGIDTDIPSLARHPGLRHRVVGDIANLPFRSGRFDIVTANMVMEHVHDPVSILREIRRVLAPGGVFLFHTPNFLNYQIALASYMPQGIKNRIIWALERRKAEDVYPTRYEINTARQVHLLASQAGFHVKDLQLVNSAGVMALLGPLVVFELLVLRLLQVRALAPLRGNLVVVLQHAG
jgi:SAM-dependent methyltransferase